ncbi:hypothetical protein L208DRAFT_557601 [Tricholoma matsutake]|nr:hypothetical protein L208DRAFT_557601 [Tricholoma matsutake 945]
MIPTIARKSGTAFPRLEELAKHASKSKTVQFYTKDTCVEFHSILCLILRLYLKALKDMDECKAPDEGRFFHLILDIVFYGQSLYLLAYSTTNEIPPGHPGLTASSMQTCQWCREWNNRSEG